MGRGLGLLILTVLSVSAAWADSAKPVYFTFTEEMTIRIKDPDKPGDNLKITQKLPPGAVIEVGENWKSEADRFDYFRANGKANRSKFVGDFKVVAVPGWAPDQVAALNAGPKGYLLLDTVDNYKPAPENPVTESKVAEETVPTPKDEHVKDSEKIYISLNDNSRVRRADPNSDKKLLGDLETPVLKAGTLIEISPADLAAAREYSVSGKKSDFSGGVKVVSGPDLDAAEIAKLNADPIFISQELLNGGTLIDKSEIDSLDATDEEDADTEAVVVAEPECTNCGPNNPAVIAPIVDPNSVCSKLPVKAQAGCETFMNDPSIPKDALIWSVEVLANNLDGLKMSKCLHEPSKGHYSTQGMTTDKMKKGFKNPCQIKINDTRKATDPPATYRRQAYYLDMCTGTKSVSYFNLGTGTFKNKFSNVIGRKSTVLGAMMTGDKTFSYFPTVCKKNRNGKCAKPRREVFDERYRPIMKQLGRIPAVALHGLQNSDNNTGGGMSAKHWHVSPFNSSSGCPSMSVDYYKQIDEMAANGPSLVVNFGDKMEDPALCTP